MGDGGYVRVTPGVVAEIDQERAFAVDVVRRSDAVFLCAVDGELPTAEEFRAGVLDQSGLLEWVYVNAEGHPDREAAERFMLHAAAHALRELAAALGIRTEIAAALVLRWLGVT